MAVARVTEISATSPDGFQAAIDEGLARARQTLRNLKSAWIKEQRVNLDDNGSIESYQVNMLVTFILE